jgi:hypothetical protein
MKEISQVSAQNLRPPQPADDLALKAGHDLRQIHARPGAIVDMVLARQLHVGSSWNEVAESEAMEYDAHSQAQKPATEVVMFERLLIRVEIHHKRGEGRRVAQRR